jgi:thiamine biosynthesis lipoprotein
MYRLAIGLAILVVLQGSIAAAAEPVLKRYAFTEAHMGTRFKILIYAPDEDAAKRGGKAAFARVAELNGIMSDYLETSELMRLCRKAGGEPVPVSEDLFTVLSRAQEVSRRSDGAFDVTIGPVVRMWRRARFRKTLPTEEQRAEALALVGFEKMKLDAAKKTVQLVKEGMKLDLGGIAKGYAADQALLVLKKQGLTRALVAAGGDIAVSDAPPGEAGWKVGIAPLDDPESEPKRFVILKHGAVSTSGDAEQYVEIGGVRYSHIADPKTGLGLVGRMSATVVAKDGTTADAMTKVVAILGAKKGFPIVDATEGAAAMFIRKTDKGEVVEMTKRFKELVKDKE